MKLSKLLDAQKVKIIVDDIELWCKKLTWKELGEFQKFAGAVTDEDETSSILRICKYILENFITDEEDDKVIDIEKIEYLPVQFCVQLVEKFVSTTSKTEDIKKK